MSELYLFFGRMCRIIYACTIVSTVGCSPPSMQEKLEKSLQEVNDSFDEHFYLAEECYDNKKFSQAVESFGECIKIKPDNVLAYFWRGRSFERLEKHQEAIADYSKAIEVDPKFTLAYCSRAAVVSHRDGVLDYTSAIEIDPGYTIAYYRRGCLHDELGNLEESIKDFTMTIRLDPKFARAYFMRGLAQLKTHDLEEAIVDFDVALNIDLDYTLAYAYRGMAKEKLGLSYCSDYKNACDLGFTLLCEKYNTGCGQVTREPANYKSQILE